MANTCIKAHLALKKEHHFDVPDYPQIDILIG